MASWGRVWQLHWSFGRGIGLLCSVAFDIAFVLSFLYQPLFFTFGDLVFLSYPF